MRGRMREESQRWVGVQTRVSEATYRVNRNFGEGAICTRVGSQLFRLAITACCHYTIEVEYALQHQWWSY